jgi:Skp family chaperone for outer membrane proteins
MMRALIVLGLFVSSSALAEPGRVALVDTGRLFHQAGIAKWAAARAKLDAEEPKFVVVESPDGKKPNPHADIADPATRKVFTDLDRDALRSEAWHAHEHEVLDPIEADVMRALEAYTQSHGIAILLDRGKLDDAVLVVAAGADITGAFIKDYDAKARPRAGQK